MRILGRWTSSVLLTALVAGCNSALESGPEVDYTKHDGYVILGTKTDGFDFAKARTDAQDAISKYPDLGCMVGLFAYNPPKCLDAVRDAGKLGKIQIVAFDEEDETLQGIVDGEIHGTVVQNPYKYGYESVRVLAGLARGDQSVLPAGGFLDIPARKITKENVEEFWNELNELKKEDETEAASAGEQPGRPTVAYVTNGIASFWVIAAKGARDAARDFDVNLKVRMPPKGVEDQKRMVQELLSEKVDGIAISPIDPANQADTLAQIADQTNFITHDSDAPDSDRLCYIGMDNYTAGRLCGELVEEALPDRGTVMIFVGRLGQLNARQRRQGVIDELLGRDHDPDRYDAPGQILMN